MRFVRYDRFVCINAVVLMLAILFKLSFFVTVDLGYQQASCESWRTISWYAVAKFFLKDFVPFSSQVLFT